MTGHRLGALLLVAAVAIVAGCASPSRPVGPEEEGRPASYVDLPTDAERARVVSHVDGDTIRLRAEGEGEALAGGEETKVRLLEIDTPEVARSGSPGECFADEASDALRRMLPVGAEVLVEADEQLLDPYGRTLLYLWTPDGAFVNLELVRQGYARAVLYEPNDEYIEQLRRAESRARAAHRGLWGACG